MEIDLPEWPVLFGEGEETRRFQVVRKRGVPLLFLPDSAKLAARTLELYPAQTSVARFARAILRCALRCGLRSPHGILKLPWARDAALPRWICEKFGANAQVGMLLGNPKATGRRWILIVFDEANLPLAVVKAGVSLRAMELIRAEGNCIQNLPDELLGKPELLGRLDDNIAALAIAYAPGKTPSSDTIPDQIGPVLSSWIDTTTQFQLSDIPAWHRLSAVAPATLVNRIANLRVFKTTMHGDFAPWNIREHRGRWTVLDWERGETIGVPAWDWFHYVIQSAALVDRASTEVIEETVNALIRTPAFVSYAALSGITGFERDLLRAYLMYCTRVLRVSEGSDRLTDLLEMLSE